MIKVTYERTTDACHMEDVWFKIVETEDRDDKLEIMDPQTGKCGFVALSDDKIGTTWQGNDNELAVFARALARHNGRKNICDTSAMTGTIY
jgi:hypothetical protein